MRPIRIRNCTIVSITFRQTFPTRSRRQRTDIGKYFFVNRTIQHWNQLPAEVLGTLLCKPIIFEKRVRKVIIEVS